MVHHITHKENDLDREFLHSLPLKEYSNKYFIYFSMHHAHTTYAIHFNVYTMHYKIYRMQKDAPIKANFWLGFIIGSVKGGMSSWVGWETGIVFLNSGKSGLLSGKEVRDGCMLVNRLDGPGGVLGKTGGGTGNIQGTENKSLWK